MKHLQSVKSKISKLLAFAVVTGILSSSAVTAQAATLKDMNSVAPYAKEAVTALAASNIIGGGSNGYFKPAETVTRGQMVIMLVKALGYDTANIPSTPTFKDVPANHWAFKYVEAAYREGILTKGATGKFGINEGCTRQQMAAMFVRALGLKDEMINNQQELINVNNLKDKDKVATWARDHVEFVIASELMVGSDGKFLASSPASRQQAAVVIYRYLNNKSKTAEMAKVFTQPVQYPELYEALKNNMVNYNGELASTMLMKMYNKSFNEEVNYNFNLAGASNGDNSKLKVKMDFFGTGLPTSSMEYDTISIGSKLFVKLNGETKWTLVPADEAASLGSNSTKAKFEQFMRSYRKLTIINAGQVQMNGVTATKYEITLNREAFKAAFSELAGAGYFDQDSDMEEILTNPFEGKVEVYLDQQNRIIRDRYDFKANMKFEDYGDDIDITSSVDTSYTNFGSVTEIKAPALSEIDNSGSM